MFADIQNSAAAFDYFFFLISTSRLFYQSTNFIVDCRPVDDVISTKCEQTLSLIYQVAKRFRRPW